MDYVREFHAQNDYEKLELAINRAIDRCIMEGVLKDFLMEHRSEVVKVTQLDYTFDRQIELEREDARETGLAEGREIGREEGREIGRAEGRAQGRAEGRAEGRAQGREYEVFHSVQEGDYDAKRGAQKLNMTLEDFLKKMKQAGFS